MPYQNFVSPRGHIIPIWPNKDCFVLAIIDMGKKYNIKKNQAEVLAVNKKFIKSTIVVTYMEAEKYINACSQSLCHVFGIF